MVTPKAMTSAAAVKTEMAIKVRVATVPFHWKRWWAGGARPTTLFASTPHLGSLGVRFLKGTP